MYILTTAQMREAERIAIEDKGVPSMLLMENAARGAAEEILRLNVKSALIFAGKGNNGGNGLAIARLLMAEGVRVKVIFIGERERASADCLKNLEILESYNADITYNDINAPIGHYDIVIDALVGTGLKSRLSGQYTEIVNNINEKAKLVLSVDCPTGVNCDTGEDYGIAVNADITVTFHRAKRGLLLYPAAVRCGRLVVKHIGIPDDTEYNCFKLDDADAKKLLPLRKADSNKGNYGRVLFVSGCDSMTGAAVINCMAAYRSGAGLVNICSSEHVINVVQNTLPEAVTSRIENIDCNYGNVTAVGSGIGISDKSREIVRYVAENTEHTIVADADALNIMAEDKSLIAFKGVITPHIKEMSRLTGLSTEHIKNNLIETALDFAAEYNVVVLLKDSHSVVASPDGRICINTTGTPAMSKGGTGDCLTGLIAGLIAQGVSVFEAACLGAYINGLAGERAAEEKGEYGILASDIADSIPHIMEKLKQTCNKKGIEM